MAIFFSRQTANLLLWLLYNLGRLPHIQEKLIQEIDKVVGYKSYITAEHVAKMTYLKFCVKESLRYLILILVYSINLGISEISITT